jgi:D-alanyl-D-alanine carboxypeptidase
VQDYSARIAQLHRSLGIPANYAAFRQLTLVEEAPADSLSELDVAVDHNGNVRHVKLFAGVAAAWNRLAVQAVAEGVGLVPLSGFRSVERQVEIFRRKISAGKSIDDILRVNAAPGYSEHHSGRAIDIGVPNEAPLTEAFENSAAFAWLNRRGGEFGFYLSYPRNNACGFDYEPWHWCWHANQTNILPRTMRDEHG